MISIIELRNTEYTRFRAFVLILIVPAAIKSTK